VKRLATAALAAAAIVAPATLATAAAPTKAERPPKVGEVNYFKVSGEQGPATNVEIYARHTDAVKMKASYGGESATAIGVEFTHIDNHRYGHPWIPDPDRGRRDLLNVMKTSIAGTGAVTLKVIAENDSGDKTKVPVQIVLSECHLEPPIYPFSCIVEP
jgi:hypothetical protein